MGSAGCANPSIVRVPGKVAGFTPLMKQTGGAAYPSPMRLLSCIGLMGFCAVSFGQYTAISLHPPGFTNSSGQSAYGGQQAGRVQDLTSGFIQYAAVWSGSSGSYTSLHPFGDGFSEALGTYGNSQ